jgi:DNA-binding GntR family transcriptional regulator
MIVIMAKQNQAQLAYEKIRDRVVSRTILQGERLVERNWAEELGVNRSDVRQALSRLLGEGLLEAGKRGGFFVREFTKADMKEFNEIRFVLESTAAKFAIERANSTDIARLEKVCDHMKMMAENGYGKGFSEADLKFHEVLMKAAHNKKLESIYKNANLPLSELSLKDYSRQVMVEDMKVHIGIVNALKEKDIVAMVKLLSTGVV